MLVTEEGYFNLSPMQNHSKSVFISMYIGRVCCNIETNKSDYEFSPLLCLVVLPYVLACL